MTLSRDRLLILALAVVAAIALPVSAQLFKDDRFLALLIVLLWMLAIAFALAGPHRRRDLAIVLGVGAIVGGIWLGGAYGQQVRVALDPTFKAQVLVQNMLTMCTSPQPSPADLKAQPELTEGTTHLVWSVSKDFDFGAWRVNVDTGTIHAVSDTARGMVDSNRCRARTDLPSAPPRIPEGVPAPPQPHSR